MRDEKVPMPQSASDAVSSLIVRHSRQLFASAGGNPADSAGFHCFILKEAGQTASGTLANPGIVEHPFDFATAKRFLLGNENHAACIDAKATSVCGLGYLDSQKVQRDAMKQTDAVTDPNSAPKQRTIFVESKVDAALNPICRFSWADVQSSMVQDVVSTHNGWLEVVRDTSNKVVAVYFQPCERVNYVVEPGGVHRHVRVTGNGFAAEKRFAVFDDHADFVIRNPEMTAEDASAATYSEMVHFRIPTGLHELYGVPVWLSAVPSIELVQMLLQWKFDFFQNRGVPEFIFLLKGAKLKPADWKKIEEQLQSHIGSGNAFKSLAINLQEIGAEIQLEKLGLDSPGGQDAFDTTKESLAMSIVTAHRVPSLLAGILIPGKLGGVNEGPMALMIFQILVVGPIQRMIQQQMGQTLGSPGAGLNLSMEDFALAKITEEIPMATMDTTSRMRQDPAAAAASGRNLNAGVKD